MNTDILNENADCSSADELKGGWDVKEIDLQRNLTIKFNNFN